MISETAYSSHTKLLGQNLPIREHGIGYLNLAFAANKGKKKLIFSFKPLKRLEGLFVWPFWFMKSIKAKIVFLLHKCFEKLKFRLNTPIKKSSLK